MRPTSFSAAVLFLLCCSPAFSQVSLQRVAMRWDLVSGASTPNTRIDLAESPLINDAGQIVFAAGLVVDNVTTSDAGVVLWNPSGLQMVAQSGAPAPGTGGGQFDFVGFRPSLSNSGQVGVAGSLKGTGLTSNNRLGAWAGTPGALDLIVRSGAPAPHYPGATFEGTGVPLVANNGNVAINAAVNDAAAPLGHTAGIWYGPRNDLQLAMRIGGAAPNSAPGTTVDDFFLLRASENGLLAIGTSISGPGPLANRQVVYAGPADDLHPVTDGIAPGTTAAFSTLTGVSINRNRQLAVNQLLSGPGVDESNDEGIWAGNPGALQLVARIGDQAPGTPAGTKFSANDHAREDQWDTLSEPTINSSGQVAFRARLDGAADESNNWGIYSGVAGNLKLIARSGDSAPGIPSAHFKGSVPGAEWISPFQSPIISDTGQIAFAAMVTGDGLPNNEVGALYMTDSAGDLHLILRGGQLFDLGAGDLRRVMGLALVSEDRSVNGSSSFNSSGQLVINVSFEDGSAGVFIATVPEPASALVLLALALACSPRRKQRL